MNKPGPSDTPLTRTGDAGGDGALKEGQLDKIKSELRHVVMRAGVSVAQRRRLSERVLYCRWPGQDQDGRKHREVMREEPFPFEGASDATIRLADMIVKENVRVLLTATKNMGLRGVDSYGDGTAGIMEKVARWLIQNKLTTEWWQEWKRLFHYGLADSPAAAVMGMYWEQRLALVAHPLTVDSLTDAVSGEGTDPMQVQAMVQALLYDPAQEESALALLGTILPGAKPKDLKRALKELALLGETSVNLPEVAENRPRPVAHRIFEDIFIPENTADFNRSRYVFHREWLSEVELEERVHTQDYDPKWVKKVLEHEGRSFLPVIVQQERLSQINANWPGVIDVNIYRGLYEVITAYYRAVNDDGVPALYTVTLHGSVDFPATPRRLSPYGHGKYPFAFYAHEAMSGRIWESRGIPELIASDQYTIKLHVDAINDNAQLSTLPPVKVPATRPDMRVNLAPLEEIRENRPGEVSFMTPPQYPSTAAKAGADALGRVSTYFGRPVEGVSAQLVTGYAQGLVDDAMPTVREAILQMLSNAMQFMSEEELERIHPGAGRLAQLDPKELRGRYDILVSFDARTLDIEWLETMGDLFGKYVLSWDTMSVVDRGDLVRWFAGKIDSDSLDFIATADEASASEMKDEDANFAFIAAGGEPPMAEAGQNFAARYQRLLENVQKNPQSVAMWPAPNQAVLQARLEHLKFMMEQSQNARIGRVGATPALTPQ